MQKTLTLHFDASKLPLYQGRPMTETELYEMVNGALSTVFGDYDRPGCRYDDERKVEEAMIEPKDLKPQA